MSLIINTEMDFSGHSSNIYLKLKVDKFI